MTEIRTFTEAELAEMRKIMRSKDHPEVVADAEPRRDYLRRNVPAKTEGDIVVGDKALLEKLGITGFGDSR